MYRVTFVTDIMTPYMIAVFEALAVRCELTVIFSSVTGTRAMPWSHADLGFTYRVVGGAKLSRSTPDATDFYPSPRILKHLASSRPDVVMSGGFSFPSLYAAAYCKVTRSCMLIYSDGTRGSESGIGRGQRLTRRLLSRLSAGAMGNSSQAVDRFVELGFGPVFLVPHSTNIDPFLQVGREREYRRSGELRVITAGRLIPRKGVDRLLRAVSRARREGTEVHLTLVGTGEAENDLRALARGLGLHDVEWAGFVEQYSLPKLFAGEDVFAFPTLDDPFGIVLLEAAAAGLPLVASPHGGATGEIVVEGQTGFVVNPDDVAAFATALTTLAEDPSLAERIGRAANVVAAGRTPTATAEAYLRAAGVARARKAAN